MFCEKCGTPSNENAAFCGNCGNPLNSVQTEVEIAVQEEAVNIEAVNEEQPVKTKKSKTPLIVGISIGAVLLIGIIVALIILIPKFIDGNTNANQPVVQEASVEIAGKWYIIGSIEKYNTPNEVIDYTYSRMLDSFEFKGNGTCIRTFLEEDRQSKGKYTIEGDVLACEFEGDTIKYRLVEKEDEMYLVDYKENKYGRHAKIVSRNENAVWDKLEKQSKEAAKVFGSKEWLGTWHIVGSFSAVNEPNEDVHYYDDVSGVYEFYDDGTFNNSFSGTGRYIIENDLLVMVDENGSNSTYKIIERDDMLFFDYNYDYETSGGYILKRDFSITDDDLRAKTEAVMSKDNLFGRWYVMASVDDYGTSGQKITYDYDHCQYDFYMGGDMVYVYGDRGTVKEGIYFFDGNVFTIIYDDNGTETYEVKRIGDDLVMLPEGDNDGFLLSQSLSY